MFKVGEKIKVKEDLVLGGRYGGIIFVNSMRNKYIYADDVRGKEVVYSGFIYTEEMLEKIQPDDIGKYWDKIGFVYPDPDNKKTVCFESVLPVDMFHTGTDWHRGYDCHCWVTDSNSITKVRLKKVKVKDADLIVTNKNTIENFVTAKKIYPLLDKLETTRDGLYDGNITFQIICDFGIEVILRDYDTKTKYYLAEKSNLIGANNNEEETTPKCVEVEEEMPKENVENSVEELKEVTKALSELKETISKRDPFEKAMTEAIIEKGKEIATKDLEDRIKDNLDKFIEEKYGVLPKILKIKNEDKPEKEMKGLFHKDFEKICKIVNADIPLMLVGGAGAGKNHTLEQVAEALDLTFYTTNAINQEYKLTGFIDANGKYHETEFYKAFTKGGMFFLDEIDASCPEALIILNGAIANRYFDFPTGRVNAHKDFRVVCAGNTFGRGADMVYVGRNVLDGATLDRFVTLEFDYDKNIEKQLAYDDDLYNFIRALREAIEKSGLRYIVSMRALINSTKLLRIGIDKKTVLKTSIIKNMQIDDINSIIKKISLNNEWTKALKELSDVQC